MTFSLSSPPYEMQLDDIETPATFGGLEGCLNATISPSILSPQEKTLPKIWKKRDYYQRDFQNNDEYLFSCEKKGKFYNNTNDLSSHTISSLPQ